MEAVVTRAIWIVTLTALFSHTDAQMFFCDQTRTGVSVFTEPQMLTSMELRSKSSGYDRNLDLCECTLKANGSVFVRSTVKFMTDPDDAESNSTCGPLLKFSNHEASVFACPSKQKEMNDSVVSHHLGDGEELKIEVINPGKTGIQAMISFDATVFVGSFDLRCENIRAATSRDVCPCSAYAALMGGPGFVSGKDVPLGTKFAVALVCVAAFLVIVAIIFVIWWKKLRNKNHDDVKDGPEGPVQPVPAPPHMEKGHVNPQFTDIGRGQHVNVDGDPELNLAMQTPTGSMGSKGLRGSTDSGLYSQGNGHYYANVPGEHADGLPPDMLYTPGLNLSGHADLQGPVIPRSNKPVDVDALYAKPMKGQHGIRPKTGSQDQLHQPQQPQHPQAVNMQRPYPHSQHPPGPSPEWAVNECYVSDSSHNASQGSLNTSQPVSTVETDV